MIVKLQKAGAGFKGAFTYAMRDRGQDEKGERLKTGDRVAFTETINMANSDPRAALREMIHLANHAGEIVRGRAKDKETGETGKNTDRIERPVKTVSLSWHPDDKPSQAQQMEAAQDFLKRMNWEKCQCLVIGHKDEPHAHLHLIINRIDPETGRLGVSTSMERRRSHDWELAYERGLGKDFTSQQHENAKPKTPAAERKTRTEKTHEDAFVAAQIAGFERQGPSLKDLKQAQRAEREAFYDKKLIREQYRQSRAEARADVSAAFKGEWRDYYKAAKSGQTVEGQRQDIAKRQRDATKIAEAAADEKLEAQRETDYKALLERQQDDRQNFLEHGTWPQTQEEPSLPEGSVKAQTAPQAERPAGPEDPRAPIVPEAREQDRRDRPEASLHIATPQGPEEGAEKAPQKDATDLGAAGIGAVIEGVEKALSSLIAPPTPAEQRAAKRQAQREEVGEENREQQREAQKLKGLEDLANKMELERQEQETKDREQEAEKPDRFRERGGE